MYSSVLDYVRACEICQKTKTSKHQKRAPLKPLEVVPAFGRVHLDFVGPLPETPDKYKHILVVIDSSTLWPEAFPTKTTSAEEIAQILYKEIICRYGTMHHIVTDGGSSFCNKLIAELCKLLKIKHTFSSPHDPQGDGKCERMNQTLIKSLRLECKKQTEWADRIPSVLFSYRATVATPLGISPHYALYGRPMNFAIDTTLLTDVETAQDLQGYTTHLIPKLKQVHEAIQDNQKDSNITSKRTYDRNSRDPDIVLGSKVLMHDATTKKGECSKLKKRWIGPYLVVDKSDDGVLYKLRHCQTGKQQKRMIHYNRLKPYNENKELFYTRNKIAPQSQTQPQTQSQTDSLQSDWLEIKRISRGKRIKGKDTCLLDGRFDYSRTDREHHRLCKDDVLFSARSAEKT